MHPADSLRSIVDEKENQQTVQKELKQELLLCDSRGRLNPEAVAWARRPFPVLNVHGNFPFRKAIERWELYSDQGLLSASCVLTDHTAIMRMELVRAGGAGVISRTIRRGFTEARRLALPQRWSDELAIEMDDVRLAVKPARPADPDEADAPEQPERGVAQKIGRKIRKLADRVTSRTPADELAVRFSGEHGEPVTGTFDLPRAPEVESLNVMAAWSRRRFVWVSRTLYPRASGQVQLVGGDVDFKSGRTYAVRDVIRGVFPLQMSGQRAVCMDVSGKQSYGFVAGADWSRGTGMNENAIILDGRVYKLFDAVRFLPVEGGGTALRTLSSQAVDLLFEPEHESVVEGKVLVLGARLRRRTGLFTGEIRLGQKRFKLAGARGTVEDFQYLG